MDKRIKIAIGVGLTIGVVIIGIRHRLRQKGWSHNKFLANTFNVPYKPLTEGLDKKYSDLQEQTENQETKDGIEFRATGDASPKPVTRKYDACGGCTPPKKCVSGWCV